MGSGKVEDLRPDTIGHSLVVKVVDAKIVVDKPARGTLKPQKVAECTVGDETGTILLTARNEQVELMKPGNYVALINARIDMFRGSMRLVVSQKGKMEVASGHSFKPKSDFNLSLVEYELVPVPQSAAPVAQAEEAKSPVPVSEESAGASNPAANGAEGFEEADAPIPAAAS